MMKPIEMKLKPMDTAPTDGSYLILFAESGYNSTPLRCQVCRYDKNYRPLYPWQTYDNESFLESEEEQPVGWLPLPSYEPVTLSDAVSIMASTSHSLSTEERAILKRVAKCLRAIKL